jgi:hypothetical protein
VRGVRTAATAAAFVVVLGTVATVTYVTVREDPPPPTTTTTTTSRAPTAEEVAEAVTTALSRGLDVRLDAAEAACVGGGLIELVGPPRLEEMATTGAGVEDLDEVESAGLIRIVVQCVPPAKAEALLSTEPPPPTIAGLPDEGADG